jgi:hypothetical protein
VGRGGAGRQRHGPNWRDGGKPRSALAPTNGQHSSSTGTAVPCPPHPASARDDGKSVARTTCRGAAADAVPGQASGLVGPRHRSTGAATGTSTCSGRPRSVPWPASRGVRDAATMTSDVGARGFDLLRCWWLPPRRFVLRLGGASVGRGINRTACVTVLVRI